MTATVAAAALLATGYSLTGYSPTSSMRCTTVQCVAAESISLESEVGRRRNLAIISHPDAGKTTLTEKLLLYGGAINQAGAVKAKGEQRRATSDFMELEQQRGISISSTVLSYEYDGRVVSILDTPGHQDFSEDTYRTLAAADNAVMLVDAAKGLEPQTRKSVPHHTPGAPRHPTSVLAVARGTGSSRLPIFADCPSSRLSISWTAPR